MALNISIAFHSSSQLDANKIGELISKEKYDVYYISENNPDKLSTRSQFVKKSDALIVITSLKFQRSIECMEILHFAKDLKLPIFGIKFDLGFIPFGALGAIISGTEHGIVEIDDKNEINSFLAPIFTSLEQLRLKLKDKIHEPIIDPSRVASPHIQIDLTKKETNVLLSYHTDSKDISSLIEEAFTKFKIDFLSENSSSGTSNVTSSNVIVIIMSPGYEENFNCRQVIETARSLNKKIIPVSKTRAWKPEGWLGLLIAGKLFYRIFDSQQAYTETFTYGPMSSLIDAVIVSIYPQSDNVKKEEALKESLKKQIEECKLKLKEWPPKIKTKRKREKPKSVKVVLKEPETKIEIHNIKYVCSRVLTPPDNVLDKYGAALRVESKFDAMISYQWNTQDFVSHIFMNLRMQSLNNWFDIWGGMEGNTNEAMASAIENSRVMLVFLTNKYLSSPNCLLEFKYAIECGKPFIFIIVEPLENIEPWVQKQLDDGYIFELSSIDEAINSKINGVPKLNIISQAIRNIGFAQPDFEILDFSEEVIELKEILNAAKDEIASQTGISRYKTCTRCKKEYEDSNNKKGDCKSHRLYYLGGTIIEGNWVCCKQQSKTSFGCKDDVHIDMERKWVKDKWDPV